VTQTTFPSTLLEKYAYDNNGNLQTKTDRNGNTITYSYDNLNRMVTKQYPGSGGSVSYAYDLASRLTQVSDATGTYGFSFDNMGRLIGTTTQYSFLPGNTYTNAYQYDAASNRTGFTAPDGSTNTYAYDSLNRLNTLTNSVTGQFGFGYDGLSRRTSLTRPNAVNTSYSYDSLSRLLSVLHQNGSTVLDGANYTYDNAGNRMSKLNQLNGITENYAYDPTYQLTQVQQVVNGTPSATESYSYDALGNRLSSLDVASYSYNNSNQLTSSSDGYSYTYDNNGNTLTKSAASGTTQYGWDFENRLISVTLPNGGGTVSYRYDPYGRRIQKNSASGTSNYLYDGPDMFAELDGTGSVVASYKHGPDQDEPLAEVRSGTTSLYVGDGLGSITSLSTSSGTLANSYIYKAFGNPSSIGTLANPFQYTAREFDSETGLLYLRARYMDTATGRFLSEDPVSFSGGINFYRYAANDPMILVDPSGLSPDCPNCSIVVKCRGIQYKHLGLLGVKHCDARVVDRNGAEHSLSGGPTGDPLNSDLSAWDCTAGTCGSTSLGPFTGHTVYKKKPADCDQADCLVRNADLFQNQPDHPKYHAVGGPNSDTWLKNTFGTCGMSLHIRWYGSPILFFWPLP
jgi:RHS repeat-associated protein